MKQKEKLNIENKLNKCKDVINALTEHLKNLNQELSHTQVTYEIMAVVEVDSSCIFWF